MKEITWGMDFFNEFLKGKQFILYKPLEKLGHLHSKMLNRLQTALLEHDFVIHYKKGSNMPAEYFSWLPGAKETIASISALNPFQADLYDLQMQDDNLQMLQTFITKNYTGKNPKLVPQFKGPGEIIDYNDTNAKLKINNKIKVLNVNKLKIFLKEDNSDIDSELQALNFNDFSSDMHSP
jgi:hypothetical protein